MDYLLGFIEYLKRYSFTYSQDKHKEGVYKPYMQNYITNIAKEKIKADGFNKLVADEIVHIGDVLNVPIIGIKCIYEPKHDFAPRIDGIKWG